MKKKITPSQKTKTFNQYSLIFDAVKYIPNFRKQFNKHNQKELDIWETVIANAKENGEINTELSSEKIAKMFMYMGDGYAMHFIVMGKNITETKRSFKESKSLWDELYQLLKA